MSAFPDSVAAGIELRHLRYFVAVAEELHFTRAAERLHMAQSPLSAQIRQLEQRVGATLLDRAPGRVALTPAGEALLGASYSVLADVRTGVEAVRAVQEGRRGRVHVVVGPSVGLGPVLDAVRRLGRRAPALRVDVERAGDALLRVVRREADVAVVHGPARERSLVTVALASEPRVVLLPADSAMSLSPSLTLADLPADRLVELRDEAAMSLEALLADVAAGRAVAVVPAGMAGASAGLRAVPLADALPATLLAAHRGDRPGVTTFLDALVEAARDPGGTRAA